MYSKTALCLVAIAFCIQTGVQARSLQQSLPTLGSSGSPAPAPGPSSGQCAVAYLQNAGQYSTLLSLIAASSEASSLTAILNSPTEEATILAPTDAGIEQTATQNNINLASLESDPEAITDILLYHLLHGTLSAPDFQNGYSFNTFYRLGDVEQSVTVQGQGSSATIVAANSTAPLTGNVGTACLFKIAPINGLLLPKA